MRVCRICFFIGWFVLVSIGTGLDARSVELEKIAQSCTPGVKEAFEAILAMPEGYALAESVQAEGDFSVQLSRGSIGFEACWNPRSRAIVLNGSHQRSRGSLIRSILFELHNARSNEELLELQRQAAQGELSKESFVEAVETIEYGNVLETSRMLEEGIAMNIFPRDADYPIEMGFREHYMLQQLTGHSQQIARSYDALCPFRDLKRPFRGLLGDISRLDGFQRGELLQLVEIAADLASSNRNRIYWGTRQLRLIWSRMGPHDWRLPWMQRLSLTPDRCRRS